MNLKDITLGQYISFQKEYKDDLTEREQVKLIQKHFFGNVAGVEKMSYRKVSKMAKEFSEVFKRPDEELTVAFKLNGVEFGFIPDLENFTFEEVMDADMYLPEPLEHHRLMAILYRPITEYEETRKWFFGKKNKTGKYRIATYYGTRGFDEIMLDMPLNIYFGAVGFFERLGTALRTAFPSYLPQEEVAMDPLPQEKPSENDGNGISH